MDIRSFLRWYFTQTNTGGTIHQFTYAIAIPLLVVCVIFAMFGAVSSLSHPVVVDTRDTHYQVTTAPTTIPTSVPTTQAIISSTKIPVNKPKSTTNVINTDTYQVITNDAMDHYEVTGKGDQSVPNIIIGGHGPVTVTGEIIDRTQFDPYLGAKLIVDTKDESEQQTYYALSAANGQKQSKMITIPERFYYLDVTALHGAAWKITLDD